MRERNFLPESETPSLAQRILEKHALTHTLARSLLVELEQKGQHNTMSKKNPRTSKQPRAQKNHVMSFDEVVAFGKIWNKAKDLDEVTKATGFSSIKASGLAARLRKKGAKLQVFERRGRKGLDVKVLNAAL